MAIDWDSLRPKKTPTKKQRGLYQKWLKYLKDSRLSEDEIHKRAARFAEQGSDPEID